MSKRDKIFLVAVMYCTAVTAIETGAVGYIFAAVTALIVVFWINGGD